MKVIDLDNTLIAKKGKRKYHIYWFEYHNPLNWGKTEQEGITNIMSHFSPESKWDYDGNDGWIEVQVVDTFEAKDFKEAKRIVSSNYECGSEGVFSVFDKYNERIFTEEDLEEEVV